MRSSETLHLIGAGNAVFSARGSAAGNKGRSHGALDVLTPREKEVLSLMVAGESTVRIAEAMGVTTGTVVYTSGTCWPNSGFTAVCRPLLWPASCSA